MRATTMLLFAVAIVWNAGAPPAAAASDALEIEAMEFKAGDETVEAELGHFYVPENRTKKDSHRIKLAFVRFPSTSKNPGPPIVYLAGGPGGSGSGTARGSRFPLFMAMREFGDVIAFDQRGTGMSEPDLQCPEVPPLPLDEPGDPAKLRPVAVAAARACAEALREKGHDLSGYNTRENADDLEALREVLGARRLTLWGISYGTHLALAMMKRHPESIERVILAGVEGLHHTYKLPSDQQRLLEEIAELAKADPAVRGSLPDLMASIKTLLVQLRKEPVSVAMVDPRSGQPANVVIGAYDLQAVLAGMLRGPETFSAMPDLVARLEGGDWLALALPVAGSRLRQGFSGMTLAMDCASGMTREWAERIEREAANTVLADAINWPFPQLCDGLGVDDLGDEFRAPARSSIPALLISGTLDGRTPPTNAEAAMKYLSQASHLVIEGAGHSDPLFLSSPEILETMKTFMRGETVTTTRITLDPVSFQAPRTIVPVAENVLAGYQGKYRLGETDVSVMKAGPLLFAMVRGRPFALRPTSDTDFFVEGGTQRIHFEKGDDGKIKHLLLLDGAATEGQMAVRVD